MATITVLKSPFPADYQDLDDAPPWSYSGAAFKSWVFEVLQDCQGEYPKNIRMAMETAEVLGFELAFSQKPQQRRIR